MRRETGFSFGVLMLLVTFFLGCKKNDTPAPTVPKPELFASGIIKAASGGTLENANGIKISFPPNAIPQDLEVKIGVRGDEPVSVGNSKMKVVGTPFTVVLPIDSLNKAATIEFSKPAGFTTTDEIGYFAFNGKTYLPLDYEIVSNKVSVKLDVTNYIEKYQPANGRVQGLISGLVIIGIIYKQIPPANEIGLKEVSVNADGSLSYSEVGSIVPSDKTVIFIHGMFSSPDTWEKFIPLFIGKTKNSCNRFLTYGYNSALPIDYNGQAFADILKTKFTGKKVDIVAHSMGGLVSRSAIENHEASAVVKNLITLGTPHQGSPLVGLRYLLGIIVASDGIAESVAYNVSTQGIKDMLPGSSFLTKLNSNTKSDVPYYALFAENDPCEAYAPFLGIQLALCWPPSNEIFLQGKDDGVVQERSALGIINNNNLGLPTQLFLPDFVAHTSMVKNEGFINLVAGYLNKQNQAVSTTGLVVYFPFSGNTNDLSGNNNNGILHGAQLTEDRKGNPNSAYLFNGSSDYIEIPYNQSLDLTDEISISCWISCADLSLSQRIFDKTTVSQSDAYMVDIHPSHRLRFIVANPLPGAYQSQSNDVLTQNNSWYHIVVTYDKSNVRFYFNGVIDTVNPVTGSSTLNSNPIRIGANSLLNGNWFTGKIDDIRLYNRALNDNEVLSLYNE
jgi:pimeloyl-ACP methyl ester carboxylesterase